jgi:hypothetical protein
MAGGDAPTLLDLVEDPLDGVARQDTPVVNTGNATRPFGSKT